MSRIALLALTFSLAGCGIDNGFQGQIDPNGIDTSVDTPPDTDPEPIGDRPIAVCDVTPDSVQPPFETARFLGGNSYDPGGHVITSWVWTLSERPSGSAITLPNTPSSPDRQFMPDLGGTYTGHLVVTTDDNRSSEPCEVSLEAVPSQDFWIEMFWTLAEDDMDLHLLAPGGTPESNLDCYYANKTPNWGGPGSGDDPALDLDDIPGTGPENINITSPQPGRFKVFVNDYTGSNGYGGDPTSGNATTVNIYVGGALVWSDTRSITGDGSNTYFATVDWPGGTVTPCNSSGC